jgi:hypothetical protein
MVGPVKLYDWVPTVELDVVEEELVDAMVDEVVVIFIVPETDHPPLELDVEEVEVVADMAPIEVRPSPKTTNRMTSPVNALCMTRFKVYYYKSITYSCCWASCSLRYF